MSGNTVSAAGQSQADAAVGWMLLDAFPPAVRRALQASVNNWHPLKVAEMLMRESYWYGDAGAVRQVVQTIRNEDLKDIREFGKKWPGGRSPAQIANASIQTYEAHRSY